MKKNGNRKRKNRTIGFSAFALTLIAVIFGICGCVLVEPQNPISSNAVKPIALDRLENSGEMQGLYASIAAASYEKQSDSAKTDSKGGQGEDEMEKASEPTPPPTPTPEVTPQDNEEKTEDEAEPAPTPENETPNESENQNENKEQPSHDEQETVQTDEEAAEGEQETIQDGTDKGVEGENNQKEGGDIESGTKSASNTDKSHGSGNGRHGGSGGHNSGGEGNDSGAGNGDGDNSNGDNSGGNDSGGDNNDGDSGNGNPGGGTGTPEAEELGIATTLKNSIVSITDLENDMLNFTAYIVNGEEDMSLKVNIVNSGTDNQGEYLTPDDIDYHTKLTLGKNYITMYIKQNSITIREVKFTVDYVAEKAGPEKEMVGEHPPTLSTNLDGLTKEITNRDFAITVTATDYQNEPIYSSHITVTLDGKKITNPTGLTTFAYQLYLSQPEEGDIRNYTVTVTAWDDNGNSVYRQYTITYHFVDTGGKTGEATIYIDATTVGLGILEAPYTYDIISGVPASYAVLEALTGEDGYGYDVEYTGTPDVGFYLARISRTSMAKSAKIPDELWEKILEDGLSQSDPADKNNSLGEFDYTQGSGWMYEVEGIGFPGRGLSEYFLNDGDILYLRFTLAYGKDVGGYEASGGTYGKLQSYGGKWVNGLYIPSAEHSNPTPAPSPSPTPSPTPPPEETPTPSPSDNTPTPPTEETPAPPPEATPTPPPEETHVPPPEETPAPPTDDTPTPPTDDTPTPPTDDTPTPPTDDTPTPPTDTE